MFVLIVESCADLSAAWRLHLEAQGAGVIVAETGAGAVQALATADIDVVILDLHLARGSAMAVADYAQFRRPDAAIVFVTDSTVFSDGSIFALAPNARAFLPSRIGPADLTAVVEYCARKAA